MMDRRPWRPLLCSRMAVGLLGLTALEASCALASHRPSVTHYSGGASRCQDKRRLVCL